MASEMKLIQLVSSFFCKRRQFS